jgi:hypothetical protein
MGTRVFGNADPHRLRVSLFGRKSQLGQESVRMNKDEQCRSVLNSIQEGRTKMFWHITGANQAHGYEIQEVDAGKKIKGSKRNGMVDNDAVPSYYSVTQPTLAP